MGQLVTILYAIIGMPLFLLWASQMGTLLASIFKVSYYNICCGLCRRGKRRKAMALNAKNKRLEEKEKLQSMIEATEAGSMGFDDDEKSFQRLFTTSESGKRFCTEFLRFVKIVLIHNVSKD